MKNHPDSEDGGSSDVQLLTLTTGSVCVQRARAVWTPWIHLIPQFQAEENTKQDKSNIC